MWSHLHAAARKPPGQGLRLGRVCRLLTDLLTTHRLPRRFGAGGSRSIGEAHEAPGAAGRWRSLRSRGRSARCPRSPADGRGRGGSSRTVILGRRSRTRGAGGRVPRPGDRGGVATRLQDASVGQLTRARSAAERSLRSPRSTGQYARCLPPAWTGPDFREVVGNAGRAAAARVDRGTDRRRRCVHRTIRRRRDRGMGRIPRSSLTRPRRGPPPQRQPVGIPRFLRRRHRDQSADLSGACPAAYRRPRTPNAESSRSVVVAAARARRSAPAQRRQRVGVEHPAFAALALFTQRVSRGMIVHSKRREGPWAITRATRRAWSKRSTMLIGMCVSSLRRFDVQRTWHAALAEGRRHHRCAEGLEDGHARCEGHHHWC